MTISVADIKFVRSLQQKKFRKEYGLFVTEGIKPVKELLNSGLEIERVYATEALDFLPNDHIVISEKELGRISGLKNPNRVLALARIPTTQFSWEKPLVLLLDGISDPGNMGTIVRTAKWFGVTDIVCINDCVDAYDRKVVQSTMGALFHVSILYTEIDNVLKQADDHGYAICGTDMYGDSIFDFKPFKKTILAIGSESHGLSEGIRSSCKGLISVPNLESEQKVESLNAGIATGIVLSQLTKKTALG
ncbi:MAG: RNA methyltransferase [Flavobacteriales bacterium]|nr:RNA methyltransferase [Flavobacteriales bacterium]MCB9203519.1 RNA methyltransferase [Flavobacteriales bacterium]